jgi:hypothetical protein
MNGLEYGAMSGRRLMKTPASLSSMHILDGERFIYFGKWPAFSDEWEQ